MASNGTKILMKVNECFSDYDNVQEAFVDLGKEEFCRKIYENARDDLLEHFPDVFDWIEHFDSSIINCFGALGVEDAQAIREIVERWNNDVFSEFKNNLNIVENIMNEKGMPDLFSAFKWLAELKEPKGYPYDTALYNFRKSVAGLDDHIEYGSQCMVVYGADYGNEYFVLLPDHIIEEVDSNPENYVFFWLYYA